MLKVRKLSELLKLKIGDICDRILAEVTHNIEDYGYKPIPKVSNERAFIHTSTNDEVEACDVLADIVINKPSSKESVSICKAVGEVSDIDIRKAVVQAAKRKRASIRRNKFFTWDYVEKIISECNIRVERKNDSIKEFVPTFKRERRRNK